MNWQPNAGPGIARARAGMLGRLRDYFAAANVLEVTTPAVSATTVTDPNIESLHVQAENGRGFLQSSPEYYMKRLPAAGYPDIFQVAEVYRDGESGKRHLQAFTLLEWYRIGFELEQIIADTLALLRVMTDQLEQRKSVQLTYSQAFEDATGLDPLSADSGELADLLDADADLRRALGDDRDAWLDLAMTTRVAASFPGERLTVITHYPASQAALARLASDDPSVADRFEIFYGDLELANGFVELTDPDEQKARFESDRERRRAVGQPAHAIDERLLAALAAGLPECAGVALGLDRVLMIDQALEDICKVRSFTPELRHDH